MTHRPTFVLAGLSLVSSFLLPLSPPISAQSLEAPPNATSSASGVPCSARARGAGLPAVAGGGEGTGPRILVYDNNTKHGHALAAANAVSPSGVTQAISLDFDSLLAIGGWDLVVMDCPSTAPVWDDTVNYVQNGGAVILSYWNWDVEPALAAAFECQVASSLSLDGTTLVDAGTLGIFNGVSMPNSDWHDHWNDDGDHFLPQGTGVGIAHLGNPLTPCMVLGNSGQTIAAPVLDEAGDTWINDGSAVLLWRQMIEEVLGGGASCVERQGVLGLNPDLCACVNEPNMGGTWTPTVDAVPTIGDATIATFISIGLGGPTAGVVSFGHELLILPPYLLSQASGQHAIPIANHPVMQGWVGYAQGMRLETNTTTGAIHVVMGNALDVVTGF